MTIGIGDPNFFDFSDIWLSNPKCLKIKKEVWETTHIDGTNGLAGSQIAKELQEVKKRLKIWNK